MSSHVVRDGACQEMGLPFCFWCKLQPSGKGRRQHQGWLLTSQRDDHSGMSPCNWNTGHYSITIYPVRNLPKMTLCMTLLTVLWLWMQYHKHLVQYWLLFTSTKTIFCLFHVEEVCVICVKIITSHWVPRKCSDFLDDVYYIIFHNIFICIFNFRL